MQRLARIVAVALVVVGTARGAGAQSSSRADAPFAEGLTYHRQAEQTDVPGLARDLILRAIGCYRLAVDADPQHYPSQSMWGIGLTQLAELETNRTARAALVSEARQRLQIARGCPGADARVDYHWGAFLLLRESAVPTEAAARRAVLEEARTSLEAALQQKPTAGLYGLLGLSLLRLSEYADSADQRRAQLLAGLDHFEVMAKTDPQYRDPVALQGWGNALIELYRLDQDGQRLTDAESKFNQLLQLTPNDPVAHYNLACVLAMQGRATDALDRLKIGVDKDPRAILLLNAERDPDLAAVRALPQYRETFQTGLTRLAAARAEQLNRAGIDLMRQAELLTNDLARATALRRDAMDRYREALQLNPNDGRAHYLWAVCLTQLIATAPDQRDADQYIPLARERFALAARAPNADLAVHEGRGQFLLQTALPRQTDKTERIRTLQQVRESYATALSKAAFSGDQARLSATLGVVLVQLTEEDPAADKRALLREALRHFEAIRKVSTLPRIEQFYEYWGIALLRLGQLERNTLQLRQAVERLQTALDRDPDRLVSRYNLACAYSLLNQTTSALRHLRICLTQDTNGVLRASLLTDPDLAAVRDTTEYRELVGISTNAPAAAPSPP